MRQSAVEIDHAIVDVAAGIFATYGFGHASVQQIADAVGYSKPGLLHRFGSKASLLRAVLDEVSATVEEIVTEVESHRGSPDQVQRLLETVARKALSRPGMLHMALMAWEPDAGEPHLAALQATGARLFAALGPLSEGPLRRLRLLLALRLMVAAAQTQHSPAHAEVHVHPEELVPALVTIGSRVVEPGTS